MWLMTAPTFQLIPWMVGAGSVISNLTRFFRVQFLQILKCCGGFPLEYHASELEQQLAFCLLDDIGLDDFLINDREYNRVALKFGQVLLE